MNELSKLVLSPFEWTMSDQISHSPMEMVVRLDCVGEIETAKFADAILAELKRQPLLQANATIGKTHRQSYWRPAANCDPEISWSEGNPDEGRGFPNDFVPINLDNEIGFRFYGWRFSADDRPRIVMKFVFHHACSDGKGGLGFVENTLHRYQCLMDEKVGQPSDLASVDEKQILNRNVPAANKLRVTDRIWRALVIRPKRFGNLLLSRPRLFTEYSRISNVSDKVVYADPPQQCSTELSLEETRQFSALTQTMSASSNTILARELFQAVNDCFKTEPRALRNEHTKTAATESDDKRREFQILIPFSLRDDRHKHMPVANCVSMTYVEASEKVLDSDSLNNPVLVSDLARQFNFIRRWNLQYSWVETINLYSRIWPIINFFDLRRMSRKHRQKKDRLKKMGPVTTTVMTNLGRAFSGSHLLNSAGEIAVKSLVVKSVHVSPPCSATVPLNFSINFYGNRLTLDANYLPSLLKRETAEGVLDSWKRRVVATTARLPFEKQQCG